MICARSFLTFQRSWGADSILNDVAINTSTVSKIRDGWARMTVALRLKRDDDRQLLIEQESLVQDTS